VLPFWLVSLAGLALSSLAVGLVDAATNNGWFISAASIGAFGTVWLVKYAVCDQYLFGSILDNDSSLNNLEPQDDGSQPSGVR